MEPGKRTDTTEHRSETRKGKMPLRGQRSKRKPDRGPEWAPVPMSLSLRVICEATGGLHAEKSYMQGYDLPLHLKDSSGYMSRIDLKGQGRKEGTKCTEIMRAGEDGGLAQDGFGESVGKVRLKAGSAGFSYRFDLARRRKVGRSSH